MARFQVETVKVRGGEKYIILDSQTGGQVSRDGSHQWSNHAACFGWASKCNAAGHDKPQAEPYRNPRLGMGA